MGVFSIEGRTLIAESDWLSQIDWVKLTRSNWLSQIDRVRLTRPNWLSQIDQIGLTKSNRSNLIDEVNQIDLVGMTKSYWTKSNWPSLTKSDRLSWISQYEKQKWWLNGNKHSNDSKGTKNLKPLLKPNPPNALKATYKWDKQVKARAWLSQGSRKNDDPDTKARTF